MSYYIIGVRQKKVRIPVLQDILVYDERSLLIMKPECTIGLDGTKEWLINGKLHRVTMKPECTIDSDGTKWWLNGKFHREDGPAVEDAYGTKSWWINGKYHREDGPAVEWADGDKYWLLNDKLHREDGPAIEYADGTKWWYLNGERCSKEDYWMQLYDDGKIDEIKLITELL